MSDEEKKEQIGTCKYCGQTKMIQTIAPVSQAELDNMATDMCLCPEAEKERRKKERKAKIDAFINHNFKSEWLKNDIYGAIDMIWDAEHKREGTHQSITLQPSEDETIKIWKDADYNLRIKAKTVDNCELKV